MKIVTTIVCALSMFIIAAPAQANGFNPAMIAHMIGPMMHMMGHRDNRHAYPVERSYGHGVYEPRIERGPVVIQRGMVENPGYAIGGASGGYAQGGSQFQTSSSYHEHREEFHMRQVHVEGQREVVREVVPAPVVHAHHKQPCPTRHARVYSRPRVVSRPCSCCCNSCCGTEAANPPGYRPVADPPVTYAPPDRNTGNTDNVPSDWHVVHN